MPDQIGNDPPIPDCLRRIAAVLAGVAVALGRTAASAVHTADGLTADRRVRRGIQFRFDLTRHRGAPVKGGVRMQMSDPAAM